MKTAVILLAAGRSTRFGAEDKLLATLHGRPMLAHVAKAVRRFAPDLAIAVTANPQLHPLLAGFTLVAPPERPALMADSLRAGLRVAMGQGAGRVVILLGDMPLVTAELLTALVKKAEHMGASALLHAGQPQPPACFEAPYFAALSKLSGDSGARAILAGLPAEALVSDPGGLGADIDRPGDLAALARR